MKSIGISIALLAASSVERAAAFAPGASLARAPRIPAENAFRDARPRPSAALGWSWSGRKREGGAEVVRASRAASSERGVIDVEKKPARRKFAEETDFDVIVVGAGCAGVGTALMLTRTFGLDSSRVILIEQGKEVGESFRRWPEEMRFISPSFNQQGWTDSFDLNAIHYDTSPAFTLRSEHPSGMDYALYLEGIANQGGLKVQLRTKVTSIQDVGEGEDDGPGPFEVKIEKGDRKNTLTTRYIVWAAGEFQFPRDREGSSGDGGPVLPGARNCLHNSRVRSWKDLEGDDFVIIGGYESGIDAAVNLSKAGKKCRVLASTPCWNLRTGDPSSELAPYTSDRLRDALASDTPPKLMAPLRVTGVFSASGGKYIIHARWLDADKAAPNDGVGIGMKVEGTPGEKGELVKIKTSQRPILCTGFEGSAAAEASHLFNFPDPTQKAKGCIGDGPLLTKDDESTSVPGVFLVGPSVSHGELSFCFVYKFRQRFAVVADAICRGLGMDTKETVMECRRTGMYLDDFATCEDTCGDAC